MLTLYDDLIRGGAAAVTQLVTERRQEGIDLEFKTKANSGSGTPDKNDRINLGIALSAFANSMEGLLVWGVEAKKNSEDIDCATNARPISDITRFKSEMTRLTSQALMPRHEGVRLEEIESKSKRGAGYLIMLVKRSERRPHQCQFGEKLYYKRYGDSSIVMEHYDIEDSFNRRSAPVLEIDFNIQLTHRRGGPDGLFIGVAIKFGLKNISLVSARFPYLVLQFPGDPWKIGSRFPMHYDEGKRSFFGGADEVIHPEMSLAMVNLEYELRAEQGGNIIRFREGDLPQLSVPFSFGCYNTRQSTAIVNVGPAELIKAIPDAVMI